MFLLIDADPQANATSGLGLQPEEAGEGTYELIEGAKNAEALIQTTRHSWCFHYSRAPRSRSC